MPLRLSRRSKYGNRKTVVDGLNFDSQAEARRYQELKMLWRAGRRVKEFRTQTVFPLMVNGWQVRRGLPCGFFRHGRGEVN